MPLAIGSPAPDFVLRSSDGHDVSLSSFRGHRNVVLIFYPKDQTPGCTKQLCTARDDRPAYEAAGAVVFGINGDDAASHQRFNAKHGLGIPLLVDRGLAVARRYDAALGFGPLSIVRRTVVAVDRNGTIVLYQRGMPDTTRILSAFPALEARL